MFIHVFTEEQKSNHAAFYSIISFINAAVPLFFLFSGFLQSTKEEKYSAILKKKAKSLLIPYILWTVICFFFLFSVQSFSQFVNYFREEDIVRNWQIKDYFQAFFYHRSDDILKQPLLGQFWYLRELMILTVLHPVLSFWYKKSYGALLLFVFLSYFGAIPLFVLVNQGALFFYVIGMFCAKREYSFFKISDSIKLREYAIIYLFIKILNLFSGKFSFGGLELLIYCMMILRLSKFFVLNEKIYAFLRFCSGFSFFIYAIHWPFIVNPLKAVMFKVIRNEILGFFTIGIITVSVAIGLGVAIKKICPKLFAVLTGGRI